MTFCGTGNFNFFANGKHSQGYFLPDLKLFGIFSGKFPQNCKLFISAFKEMALKRFGHTCFFLKTKTKLQCAVSIISDCFDLDNRAGTSLNYRYRQELTIVGKKSGHPQFFT